MKTENNFGFLRLLFATLVVVGHSPELIDGNRSRELLTSVFGTLSLGELAVDGFFLISGFLITKSWMQDPHVVSYLRKRCLRIYPGYLVTFLFCLLIIGPLAGGVLADLSAVDILKRCATALRLGIPYLPGSFSGLPYPSLNGSLWTISYEFGCYIALLAMGLVGLLRNPRLFLVVAAALLVTATIQHLLRPHQGIYFFVANFLRFMSIFSVGSLFYLYRDSIPYSGKLATAAALILVPLMFTPLAETALTLLGAYVMFWFALSVKTNMLSQVGTKTDISYGLYLYAWPIQNMTISLYRDISPFVLSLTTVAIAGSLALISWTFIERPALSLKRLVRPRLKEPRNAS